MILEERMYTLRVHQVQAFMEIYEREALPVITKHLGNMFGFFVSEVGMQNMLVHMWAYEDWQDREKRRHALFSDPAWHAYRVKNSEKIMIQDTRILRVASFFEPVMRSMLKAGAAHKLGAAAAK
ncbi:MAG: NIPSNAP family protein [Burkholderiales bacterium]